MLEPHDRRVLLEALRPPTGFTVHRVIATTYSLDLLALLTAPLAFSLYDRFSAVADEASSEPISATAILQAVREHAEHLTVFCQSGAIANPPKYPRLLAYLEGSVIEVRARHERAVFHPKVWVMRFVSAEGDVFYRVAVASRNLTFDRCWDTLLVLEGPLTNRTNAFTRNHPLGNFVAALPGLALRRVDKRIVSDVALLADEVRRVEFELPDGVDEIAFWPIGLDEKPTNPFDTRIDRMLVVSPFLTASQLTALRGKRAGDVLISRPETLEQQTSGALSGYAEVLVLQDGADGEDEEVNESDTPLAPMEPMPRGLHAKVYVADAGRDAHVWTGSANATHAAFHRNVEFLVQLTGKKSKLGIDAMLAAESPLRALLAAFRPSTDAKTNALAEALEERLRALQEGLTTRAWKARIAPDPEAVDQELYAITLQAGGPLPELASTSVRCRPISLTEEQSVSLEGKTRVPTAVFRRCSFGSLTTFFAIDLMVTDGDLKRRSSFVVNAQTEGMPEGRLGRILATLLDDPTKVLRFLKMLLALDGLEAMEFLEIAMAEGASSAGVGTTSDAPLLESLLRALDREPARLVEFERTLRELRLTPEGAKLLPPELDAVWTPIWAACQPRLGKRGVR